MEFEWDDKKAAANHLKHGIRFEAAVQVFSDPNRTDRLDDRMDYGEERRIAMGRVEGARLVVVYTRRGEAIRLISARKANAKERP